jgi:putative ABC transport system permease protein
VRRFYPNRDPLAGAFAYGYPIPARETMARIVGVVDDVRFTSLAAADDPAYYLPANQAGQPNAPYQARYPMVRPAIVVAASNGNATSLIGPLRDELRRFDAQLLVGFTTGEATMAAATSRQALGMGLMMVFGTMALLLAAIGVYGVIAYGAEQRRMELATRLALGAAPGHIFQMMLRTALRLAIVGLALGGSAAYGGGRLLSAYIYAMRAADPWVIVTAGATVAAVTVAATMIPALRASRLSPVRALRLE